MEPGSVFFDIGANVGVLTLYAETRGDIEVWAFEPAAVNYYNLVANCELNQLERIESVAYNSASAISAGSRICTYRKSSGVHERHPAGPRDPVGEQRLGRALGAASARQERGMSWTGFSAISFSFGTSSRSRMGEG